MVARGRVWVFVFGFFVGICLEIFLVEKGKVVSPSTTFQFSGEVFQDISITCLVILKHRHERYLTSSKQTWLPHCTDYYVVSIQKAPKKLKEKVAAQYSDNFLQRILNVKAWLDQDGSYRTGQLEAESGWEGLCKALHVTRRSVSHWLLIVPDSLMVFVENVKRFVRDFDWSDGHYLGYALRHYVADYNTLLAGILLSRGALDKLLKKFQSIEDCDGSGKFWRNEDLYLGKYLKELGILPKDTRDEELRGRFHGYNMNNLLWPGKLFLKSDYYKRALYPAPQGFNCCSPHSITVEVSDPDAMYSVYYLVHNVKTSHSEVHKPKSSNKVDNFSWKDFLREEGYNESAIENMSDEEYFKIWEKKLPLNTAYQKMRDFMKSHKKDLE